ncbi:LptF/LptG family permease [Myxosarcina sp. GI1]|uniref:LptF/LptG family permease n=1 Tax=Myxosarcina sp. GI1 TaxID=1541065 RepID=UPI00055A0F6F|nr:LptF/LptG family permease [Myxosarcina sp. GI1]
MKIGTFKIDRVKWGLSVMNFYITRELILPFLFGMGIFTSLLLSIGAVFDLIRKVTESGLFLGVAIKILFLKMPGFIVLAFPMAMLLASLMAYSRLSSDSELIALRSIGINTYRLIIPAIVFSLFIVTITFLLNNFIAPAANYQATIALEKALDRATPAFKDSNIMYPEYNKVLLPDGNKKTVLTRLFYAEEFDGKQMKNLTILDRSQGEVSQIITASSATWNISENIWDFYNGTIYIIGNDGAYSDVVRFQHQQLALPRAAFDLTQQDRDYNEMNLVQAYDYLRIIKLSGKEEKIRKLKVRIQEKISLPFVCLVFALIGVAIGIRPQNSGRATSFGICIGLIFAYYLLSFISSSLGVSGVVSPVVAAWLPNILGLGASTYLLTQAGESV